MYIYFFIILLFSLSPMHNAQQRQDNVRIQIGHQGRLVNIHQLAIQCFFPAMCVSNVSLAFVRNSHTPGVTVTGLGGVLSCSSAGVCPEPTEEQPTLPSFESVIAPDVPAVHLPDPTGSSLPPPTSTVCAVEDGGVSAAQLEGEGQQAAGMNSHPSRDCFHSCLIGDSTVPVTMWFPLMINLVRGAFSVYFPSWDELIHPLVGVHCF